MAEMFNDQRVLGVRVLSGDAVMHNDQKVVGVRALNGVLLAASAVAVATPADTNENVLATIPIPAGSMGPNGRLRITTLWTMTNSANNKTLRVRLGGTAFLQSAQSTVASGQIQTIIRNVNSEAIQKGHGVSIVNVFNTSTGGALGSGTVDTSVDQDLTITGTKASAGETLTLEDYMVELFTL